MEFAQTRRYSNRLMLSVSFRPEELVEEADKSITVASQTVRMANPVIILLDFKELLQKSFHIKEH